MTLTDLEGFAISPLQGTVWKLKSLWSYNETETLTLLLTYAKEFDYWVWKSNDLKDKVHLPPFP